MGSVLQAVFLIFFFSKLIKSQFIKRSISYIPDPKNDLENGIKTATTPKITEQDKKSD